MKKLVILLIMLSIYAGASAQDSTIAATVANDTACEDVSYSCSFIIPDLYGRYRDDSVATMIEYWENKCGKVEPLVSFKVLYAIGNGTFNEDIYDDYIIDYLLAYKANAEGRDSAAYSYYHQPVAPGYYNYIASIAATLQQRKLSPVEDILVNFYATKNDTLLTHIDSTFEGTRLYKSYVAYLKHNTSSFLFHCSAFAGAWIPDGNIKILGTHPLVGVQVGSKVNKLQFDLGLFFSFVRTPSAYTTMQDGYRVTTHNFFTGYIGLDLDYEVFRKGKNEIGALGGIGYQGLQVVPNTSENVDVNNGKSLNSFTLNGGVGYKHYLKGNKYVGIQAKYNLLFYKNKGGSDISGNVVTVALVFGAIY